MNGRFASVGPIATVLIFCFVCLTNSHANNSYSGSGALPTFAFDFNSTGSSCITNFITHTCGDIQDFGPDSLTGTIFSVSSSFSSYSEVPRFSGGTDVSATIGGGNIMLMLGNYIFNGKITSGSMDGYYCRQFDYTCDWQHVNGLVETTVYFSGQWTIPHFPEPEFWPAQGYFYVAEEHYYDHWINCNFFTQNWVCGKPASTIWIDTQIPGTTPEPNTLVLLGSGLVGLAGVLRRKRS